MELLLFPIQCKTKNRWSEEAMSLSHPAEVNDKKIFLDLGSISQVGEVWLNNKLLGITWTKPHRFDVTGLIIHGDNIMQSLQGISSMVHKNGPVMIGVLIKHLIRLEHPMLIILWIV